MHKISHFPMPITTDRLIIRPIKITDTKILYDAIIESFDELNCYMHWPKNISNLEDTEKYVKSAVKNWIEKKNEEPYLPLIILDKNTNDFIGGTSFHHYDWEIPSVETGYWIRTSKSGSGYITEAINAMTQYAFKQLKVKRISLTCDPDNIKSKNIAERLNYTLEGRLKNHRIKPDSGKIGDTLIYARYDCENLPAIMIKI